MTSWVKCVRLARPLLILVLTVFAPFVGLSNPYDHWTWYVFGFLALSIFILEVAIYKQDNIVPEQRLRQYLLDYEGWKRADEIEYYVADPQFTIRDVDDNGTLDFQQEWTRGEIGRHYDTGNAAYYLGFFKGETLLCKVHIVLFDAGKKIVVSPDWQAIGKGRIYYYLSDSVGYAYQRFLSRERGIDYSKSIRAPDRSGVFDIPVFKNAKELVV